MLKGSAAALVLLLAACGQGDEAPVQRVALDAEQPAQPEVMQQSPDTSAAVWQVADDGQALHFGNRGEAPLMSLACTPGDSPPSLTVIRHAPARPGLTALFPVIGNGLRSRFPVDARLADGEWRWEGTLVASHALLDVFAGDGPLTATLPGGGMLVIAGSPLPGRFLAWCRNGGRPASPVS